MDRYDIPYDPYRMEEYMKAGRKERAHAFSEIMKSIKEMFTKEPGERNIPTDAQAQSANTC